MAIDKAVDSTALDAILTDIANAIRSKAGPISEEITGEEVDGPIALEDLADTLSDKIVAADELPSAVGVVF